MDSSDEFEKILFFLRLTQGNIYFILRKDSRVIFYVKKIRYMSLLRWPSNAQKIKKPFIGSSLPRILRHWSLFIFLFHYH